MKVNDLNFYGSQRSPFLFICDFKADNVEVIPLDALQKLDIEFCIDEDYISTEHPHTFETIPVTFNEYKKKFDTVIEKIKSGETYLLNLTQKTKIKTLLNLKEIYSLANAHYKLRYKNDFVCFSPETFIKITDDTIHTFPMKGTIDASIIDAKETILTNEKEMAEHVMVVDLLRNDLSIISKNVRVERFRYTKTIDAGEKNLLQVVSHIKGDLDAQWHSKIGDILQALLPAGSISGTPKKKTLQIIEATEEYARDYFSGVFGVYDGESLDSGVMIRFIENTKEGFVYKSGGGITLDSDAKSEYNELLDKIYLP